MFLSKKFIKLDIFNKHHNPQLLRTTRADLERTVGIRKVLVEQQELYDKISSAVDYVKLEKMARSYFHHIPGGEQKFLRNQLAARYLIYFMSDTKYRESAKFYAMAALVNGLSNPVKEEIIPYREIIRISSKINEASSVLQNSLSSIGDSYIRLDDYESDVEKAKINFLKRCSNVSIALYLMSESIADFSYFFDHASPEEQAERLKASIVLGDIGEDIGYEKLKAYFNTQLLLKTDRKALLNPIYESISKRYGRDYETLQSLLQEKTSNIKEFLELFGIKASVTGRIKSLGSILGKMQGRFRKKGLESLNDIVAIRVIADTDIDLYMLSKRIGMFDQIVKKTDFVAKPKKNGYRSIHLKMLGNESIIYEIQLRTLEQHIQAETSASHVVYKTGKSDEFFTQQLFITEQGSKKRSKFHINDRYKSLVKKARDVGRVQSHKHASKHGLSFSNILDSMGAK